MKKKKRKKASAKKTPPKRRTGKKRGTMPIWLHLILVIVAQIGGGIGCLVWVLNNPSQVEAMGINTQFAAFGSVIVGVAVPRLIFKFLVPASCPKCSGRSIYRGGRPITYHCTACGHVHRTFVYEGRRHHHS